MSEASPVIDQVASVLAIVILILVPIGGITLFWLVHILPEKVAERRQHPQKDAIKVLCILSLVFGGMLWPIAWLWAYSRPVFHRLAYGHDKHPDHYAAAPEVAAVREDLERLGLELEALSARGELPLELQSFRKHLAELEGTAVHE